MLDYLGKYSTDEISDSCMVPEFVERCKLDVARTRRDIFPLVNAFYFQRRRNTWTASDLVLARLKFMPEPASRRSRPAPAAVGRTIILSNDVDPPQPPVVATVIVVGRNGFCPTHTRVFVVYTACNVVRSIFHTRISKSFIIYILYQYKFELYSI